jgi:UDP-hydrolysing UDP-N-acetyl-D-glucosamine 2-epimerase
VAAATSSTRTIAVITGTRAEYGLLRPVIRAILSHPKLKLELIVTGAHLLPPQRTIDEVVGEFKISATIAMQQPSQIGTFADAAALGRGITGFAEHFKSSHPDIVLVLGDRIEAFAGAAAAAVSGLVVAHLHGGDRAEGIADESLRHAISKLAHIHLPATHRSAQRLIAMGERLECVHVVGSPAIDGISDIQPLSDHEFKKLGRPEIIVLVHPVGDGDAVEFDRAAMLLKIAQRVGRVLVLHPNFDPGRTGIIRAIEQADCRVQPHLARETFIALLRRVKLLAGNSSAGLIECSALGVRCINIGRRQAGREKPPNVFDVEQWDYQTIENAVKSALNLPALALEKVQHPYGDGRAGQRTAELLAAFDLSAMGIRKQNTY